MVSLGDRAYADNLGDTEATALLQPSIAGPKAINGGRAALHDAPLTVRLDRPAPKRQLTGHRRVKVSWTVLSGILLMCGLEALLFVPTFKLGTKFLDDHKAPFAFLCLIHVGVWLALAAIYRYGEWCHHRSRRAGYLHFYRDTQLVRRVPLAVLSLGNAVLLVFASFWSTNVEATINRRNLIQILVSVELAICLPSYILYLVKVVRFNRNPTLPDVHREFQAHGNSTVDLDADASYVDMRELFDRQSDMLKYMRQYTANLQAEIYALRNELCHSRP